MYIFGSKSAQLQILVCLCAVDIICVSRFVEPSFKTIYIMLYSVLELVKPLSH